MAATLEGVLLAEEAADSEAAQAAEDRDLEVPDSAAPVLAARLPEARAEADSVRFSPAGSSAGAEDQEDAEAGARWSLS